MLSAIKRPSAGVVIKSRNGDTDLSCLTKLEQAKGFHGRYTGFNCDKTDDFKAYEEALAKGPQIKGELEQLAITASPAGRLYSAILLQRIDPKVGEKALREMSHDQSLVLWGFIGCPQWKGRLGQAATLLLNKPSLRTNYFEHVNPSLERLKKSAQKKSSP